MTIPNYPPIFHENLFPVPFHDNLKVCITIPARNEEKLITDTLMALYNQRGSYGQLLDKSTYEILILANNCSDDTIGQITRVANAYPDFRLYVADMHFEEEDAHVGICRRILMDSAAARLEAVGRRADGIIISTDADTRVDSRWLYFTLKGFSLGCEVLGGRIMITSEDKVAQIMHVKDERYRMLCVKLETIIDPVEHDPWPRHFQCFGPSTAVRCDVYRKVGGIPILPHLEDAYFAKNLYMIDAKIRHSPYVKVYSSGRLCGRVSFGFSRQLQLWKSMQLREEEVWVEGMAALRMKYLARRDMRLLFADRKSPVGQKHLLVLGGRLFIPSERMLEISAYSNYFGEFWENLLEAMEERSWLSHYPLVPIDEAILQLEKEFNTDTAA